MKRKSIFCIFALMVLLLSGCTSNNIPDNTNSASVISAEEARTFALNHAGLTENQVTFIRSERDLDDGRVKYDVEFYTNNGIEYDYEIDSYTGKILGCDLDTRP